MAAFAILFGTRHIDASEHHEGMVAAIAFESVVKLLAFLAVGVFVTYGIYDGFGDLFSRHDKSGWYKALWMIGIIVLPFLGVLIYLIANGTGMAERSADKARAQQAQVREYVQSVAGTSNGGAAGEIAKAKELRDAGAITQEEFEVLKAKALA